MNEVMNPKYKSIPLTPEAQAAIKHQLESFRKKFGRDPKPEDPSFLILMPTSRLRSATTGPSKP
jgi:hypothetical protein